MSVVFNNQVNILEYQYPILHLLFCFQAQVWWDKAVINIPVDHLIDYLAQRSRGRW